MYVMNKYTEEDKAFFQTQLLSLHAELYFLLRGSVSSPEEADDLMQSICEKAWAAFHTLKDRKKFRSWILRILKNTANDYYRRLYKEREFLLFTEEPESQEGAVLWPAREIMTQDDLSSHLVHQENRTHLIQAFDQLDEKHQRLLKLWMLNEYNQREIAEITGMNYNTVRTEIHRGLTKLSVLFQKIDRGKGNEG